MARLRSMLRTSGWAAIPLAFTTVCAAQPAPGGPAPLPAQPPAQPPATQPQAAVTEDIVVTAKRLAKARSQIQTRIGATTYTLSNQAIKNQPGGVDIPLNQTLLQTPGVSQDSYGQIHLRNDHANIQYRIDGVILPEGISFFGQSLTSRFASSIDLVTGSLPAQYGLVTTGIVDIQTKSGSFENSGSIGVYGGSRGWLEPSIEYAGSRGNLNYYFAGDYLQNDIGIENPTASHTPCMTIRSRATASDTSRTSSIRPARSQPYSASIRARSRYRITRARRRPSHLVARRRSTPLC